MIVDRPGVPAELYDKYWAALRQIGQVGTTARIVMPEDEWILGADAGLVASFAIHSKTLQDLGIVEPIVIADRVTIVVRDVRTGKTLKTLESIVSPSAGVMVGTLLFWTGRPLPIDEQAPMDGGVWVADLGGAQSSTKAVIEPSDLTATYGRGAVRGLLHVTDQGRSVTTLVESETSFATDVVDVQSLTLKATLDSVYALDIAGERALATQPHEFTGPGQPTGLWLVDTKSGEAIGSKVEADLAYRSVVGDGQIFASFSRGGKLIVTAIDLKTGSAREILARAGWPYSLVPRMSTPAVLAFVPNEDPTFDEDGRVQLPVTLLDPETGDLSLNAFTIGAP